MHIFVVPSMVSYGMVGCVNALCKANNSQTKREPKLPFGCPLTLTARGDVRRNPSTIGARRRRKWLIVSYRRIVRTGATSRTMLLKNTATVSSVGSGFHTSCFCHGNFSLIGMYVSSFRTPQNHENDCLVLETKLSFAFCATHRGRPLQTDRNLQKPPSVAA